MVREEPSYLSNLTYVTLGDAWECGKPALALWVLISGVALVVMYAGSTAAPAAVDLGIPAGALWFAGACLFAWVLRGEEVGISMPAFSAAQWLACSLLAGGVLLVIDAMPWWGVTPMMVALIIACGLLYTLEAAGRRRRGLSEDWAPTAAPD